MKKKNTTFSSSKQQSEVKKAAPPPEEKKTSGANESHNEDPTSYVITKFLRKGFTSLSTEELAATMITPDFAAAFKAKTGEDWDAQYKVKVLDRLENAKFDTRWLTKSKTLNGQFGPLFELCKQGNLSKVVEFIKKNGNDTLFATDVAMKSALHIAAANGHTKLCETLINMGASFEARDKFLRTPLHLAASGGYETVAETLIRLGADPMVKDSNGRTPLHYAACSISVELVNVLISKCPELVHIADNHARTALHYVVWNECSKQGEIANALCEAGAEIDVLDESRRTPLHYASESGKLKVIPPLVQHGAKISLRDGEKNLTAFQLAPSERVRETLIVYSSPPYNTKSEDIAYLNEALKGQKMLIRVGEETKKSFTDKGKSQTMKITKKPSRETSREAIKTEPQILDINSPMLPFNIKNNQELLINLLTRVQEYGVNSYQHVKKPYLFSGSWMESVRTVEDLMKIISGTTSSDAVMRIFNLLFPYKKPLPLAKGDELAVSEFYGEKVGSMLPEQNKPNSNGTQIMEKVYKNPENDGNEEQKMRELISKLENEVKEKTAKIEELEKKASEAEKQPKLASQVDTIELKAQLLKIQEEKDTLFAEKQALDARVNELGSELEKAQAQTAELQEILTQTNEKYVELKNQLEATGNADLEAANKKIAELEKSIETQKQVDRALRFKAGQMFLSCLEEVKNRSSATSEQMPTATNKKEEPQKFGDELDSFDPADDYALIRLLKKLEGNPPSLHQRLLNADNTGTGILTISQYTKVLENLQIPPQDVISLLRLAKAFETGSGKFRVKDFMMHLNNRAEQREKWEHELFVRVLSYLRQTNLSLHEAFGFFDVNQNGKIEFEEMAEAFNAMKIRLPRQDLKAIFAVMDKDGSGEISLEEFEEKLISVGGADLKSKPVENKEELIDNPEIPGIETVKEQEKEDEKAQAEGLGEGIEAVGTIEEDVKNEEPSPGEPENKDQPTENIENVVTNPEPAPENQQKEENEAAAALDLNDAINKAAEEAEQKMQENNGEAEKPAEIDDPEKIIVADDEENKGTEIKGNVENKNEIQENIEENVQNNNGNEGNPEFLDSLKPNTGEEIKNEVKKEEKKIDEKADMDDIAGDVIGEMIGGAGDEGKANEDIADVM